MVSVLDIEAVRERMSEQNDARLPTVGWLAGVITDFPRAARAYGTMRLGSYMEVGHVYGREARDGVWPILLGEQADHLLVQVIRGASMTRTGSIWIAGQRHATTKACWWLAERCGFSRRVAQRVIEQALNSEPWTIRRAMRAARER